MSQSKAIKNRKCEHCNMTLNTNAKGIKDHAEKCIHNKNKKR